MNVKNISKEKLDEYNPNKSYTVTDYELERIWNQILISNESLEIDLRLIEAEQILNAIYNKSAMLKDEKKRLSNMNKIENLRDILIQAKDILKVNRMQTLIISKSNLNAFKMQKEIKKLSELLNLS